MVPRALNIEAETAPVSPSHQAQMPLGNQAQMAAWNWHIGRLCPAWGSAVSVPRPQGGQGNVMDKVSMQK